MQKQMFVFLILVLVTLVFLSGCTGGNFAFSYTGDYCADGLQDRDESGLDCGGQYCDSCSSSESSQTNS